jgi:hypothetical protein
MHLLLLTLANVVESLFINKACRLLHEELLNLTFRRQFVRASMFCFVSHSNE